MANAYITRRGGSKTKSPAGIAITSPPTKTTYKAGESINLSGMVVTATYSDNTTEDVTSQCTFTPENGTVVYESTTEIDVAWEWKGAIYTASQPITVTTVLSSITVTKKPTKTSYEKGDTLNLSGMVVTATYNSGATANITGYTTSPANGSTLSTSGTVTVTVSYTEGGITKTTSFTVSVSATVKIVTWAGGSDEDVAAMITAAHNGKIKLLDYWAVGDVRTVSLSAGTNSAGTAIPAQTVELVLAHKPTSSSYYGGGEFIINQKNCLSVTNYMNSTNTNTGSFAGSDMASFLNNTSTGYLKMLPSWLRNVLLDAKVITAKTYNGTTNQTSIHKVFLPAAKEVFGGTATSAGEATSESNLTEFNILEQWDWFKTAANRIKQINGANDGWWERSLYYNNKGAFCYVYKDGSAAYGWANTSRGVAPAMLI